MEDEAYSADVGERAATSSSTSEASFNFGPGARIVSRKEFRRVFSHGKKLLGTGLILRYCQRDQRSSSLKEDLPQSQGKARLGISVNKKTGNAVTRNRLKRLAREAFRLNRPRLNSGADIVLSIQPGCAWQNFVEAEKDFLALCGKAGLLS